MIIDCEVFYADMSEYLNLTQHIEITDFLISILGALSEKIADRFADNPGKPSFFERVRSFLNANVQFTEIKIPAGWIEFKAALQQNPTFKEQLQVKTRGLVEQLVRQAREFAIEAVQYVRDQRASPNRKVVLIVDSVERLRGVGDSEDVREVFKSAETVFSSHADKLRFTALNVVYTVPPYLSALAGALGAVYAGGRIYALPSVHIYECCPQPGDEPVPHADGLARMRDVVEKRYAQWSAFFTAEQLARLAQHSGGDLRDYLRMLRLAVARVLQSGQLPVPDALITDAEDAVRNDMLPIADDDRRWLRRIMASHKAELPSLDALPDFARLQEGQIPAALPQRRGLVRRAPAAARRSERRWNRPARRLRRSGAICCPISNGRRVSPWCFCSPAIRSRSSFCATDWPKACSRAPCG